MATYFVTTSGNAGNDGLSEVNAWTLTKAFATAVANDTVYVKCGDYASEQVVTSSAGTAGNPIKFIGYTSSIGDIAVVDAYSSYTYSDFDTDLAVFPSDIMPLLNNDRGADDNPLTTDKGIVIAHAYVEIHNFMAQYHYISYQINAANVTMINCYSNETGNWDPTDPAWETDGLGNLSGYGFYTNSSATNFILKSSSVFNAGADAIFIVNATDHLGEYNQCFMDKKGNSTDYLYVLYACTDAVLNHNKAYRYVDRDDSSDLPHHSRGLGIKHGSTGCVITDFYSYNTRFMVYQETNNNTFTDVIIEGTGESFTGELIIATDSNYNVFTNITLIKASIQFSDYNAEGYSFSGSGSNNVFVNVKMESGSDTNVQNGVINITNSIWNSANSPMIGAGTNYFYNCTFYNANYFMQQDRPFTEFIFENCLFGNIDTGWKDENVSGSPKTGTLTFNNCNFDTCNFTTPTGTNITTHDPTFTNEGSFDFTLQSGSPSRDIGKTLGYNTDFLGVYRPQGSAFDLGAYEYDLSEVEEVITGGKSRATNRFRFLTR